MENENRSDKKPYRLLLPFVIYFGLVVWVTTTITIFQIAYARHIQNERFDQEGHYAYGTVVSESTQTSFLPIGRCFSNAASYVVCSYQTEDLHAYQATIEVNSSVFRYWHVGDSLPIVYLSTQPTVIRIMLPIDSEYDDLYVFDLFAFWFWNVIIGGAFFLRWLTFNDRHLVSVAIANDLSKVAFIASTLILLILIALRQGW